MKIISCNKGNFEKEVINSKTRVLVDFNANWCGPCRMLAPVLEEIASSSDNYKIVSVDVDAENELAQEYNVASIPCLVVFENGKEINRSVGLIPKDEIERLLGDN